MGQHKINKLALAKAAGEIGDKKPDAGQIASEVRWKSGSVGSLVVVLDDVGQAHIGVSGLNPLQVRELACSLIHASFVQAQQATQPRIPVIGS